MQNKHLLSIKDLTEREIKVILNDANKFLLKKRLKEKI